MIYQVIMQDEWDNLYHLGFYKDLKDAIPEVNSWLSTYNVEIDELSAYPSTFGMCFDRGLETEDAYVHIRGFIFDRLQEE